VGALNDWWQKICTESGLNLNSKELKKIDYYLLEIARNAFENIGSGEIKVIFEPKKATIIITDHGHGFENPNEDIQLGHGLHQVKKYADEFIIESNGAKFTKIPKRKKLVKTEDTDIMQGSKITFIKNFE